MPSLWKGPHVPDADGIPSIWVLLGPRPEPEDVVRREEPEEQPGPDPWGPGGVWID